MTADRFGLISAGVVISSLVTRRRSGPEITVI